MKAIQVSEYGNADVLKLVEVPLPTLKPHEALVRLKAAGLNFLDIYMRTGRRNIPLPFIPGNEGAGIVEAVGDAVTEVKPGDRVAYAARLGSYAEYNVLPASLLIPLPQEISFIEGAAFPLQGMTAHYLLHDFYPIIPRSKVLVHAAAGGVGLLLVQWLKKLKAETFGTVSTEEKAALAKAMGADHVIQYTKEDFVTAIKRLTNEKGVDYIIDGVGKETFTKDLEAVREKGWVTLFGSSSGEASPLSPNSLQSRSLTVSGGTLFNFIETRDALLKRADAVLKGMQEGWLKLKIDHVLPLADAQTAQTLLEMRQTMGKVVLQID